MKMGFAMYAGARSVGIEHHEESIFMLVEKDKSRYPELIRLWYAFYNDPMISARQAKLVIHELIDFMDCNKENELATSVVCKLLPFFNFAYQNNHDIHSTSD